MKNYVIVDIEATTPQVDQARIIEIAILVVREGKIQHQFDTLINPDAPIPDHIQKLTGISDRMVKNAPKFHQVSDKIKELLSGEIFVSHKTDFDFVLLQKYFSLMGIELKNKVLCTLKLTQKLFEDLPSYSLSFLCGHLGIPCKDRHRSLPDALLLFELMQQLMPILDARTQQQLHLPKHRKMLAKIPQLPGVAKINGQAGINFYSCENLYHWLSQHLALKWENKEYINSINQIDFYLTGSFMASCLKRPAQEKPKFVIYQFQDKSGLIRLGQGPYIKNKKALLYFKDKQSCRQRFEQIQNELSRSNSAPIKDKTSIVRHNLELQQVLSKFIPNESNLLFRSTRPIQNKYVYVHIKDQQYFAIFESETAIQKKNELPGLKYRVLGPQNYMQFLQGWQVIRNQRIKTDLILNF